MNSVKFEAYQSSDIILRSTTQSFLCRSVRTDEDFKLLGEANILQTLNLLLGCSVWIDLAMKVSSEFSRDGLCLSMFKDVRYIAILKKNCASNCNINVHKLTYSLVQILN